MDEQAAAGRSHALDGMRGVAATAVIFYHAILHYDLSLIERVLYAPMQGAASLGDLAAKAVLTVMNGETSVYLFFVLSGAVLRLSLQKGLQRSGGTASLALAFTLSRLLRLYPPVIACMMVYFLFSAAWYGAGLTGYPVVNAERFIGNASLHAIDIHGPLTTIQAEVMAIPFLLGAFVLYLRLRLLGLAIAFVASVYAVEASWLVFRLPNMHAYLCAFFAGMLVVDVAFRRALSEQGPWAGWVALAVLYLGRMVFHHSSSVALVAMVVSAGLLVGILFHGEKDHLRRVLQGPAFQFLGRISFSLYLLNVPVLWLFWTPTASSAWLHSHPVAGGILVGTGSLLLTIPLAMASERWVERPSIRLGRSVSEAIRRLAAPRAALPREAGTI